MHRFDSQGRHLQTLDAQSGVVMFEMAYNAAKQLTSVTDQLGRTTTIERDSAGTPLAVVGPFGHRTELSLNANDWLETIEDPTGAQTIASYTSDGLMTEWTTRDGNTTLSTWLGGKLASHTSPGGRTMTLTPTAVEGERHVVFETPMGRSTAYQFGMDLAGAEVRTRTLPSGLVVSGSYTAGGVSTQTAPDGTVTSTTRKADPRWSVLSMYASEHRTTLPSTLTKVIQASRATSLADPNDPFSLQSLTETRSVNGRTSTSVYNVAARTETTTSPEGRVIVVTYDEDDRVSQTRLRTPCRSHSSTTRRAGFCRPPRARG